MEFATLTSAKFVGSGYYECVFADQCVLFEKWKEPRPSAIFDWDVFHHFSHWMNKLESAPLYHNKRRLVINMWSSSYIDKIIFRRPEAVICVFIEIVRSLVLPTGQWSICLFGQRWDYQEDTGEKIQMRNHQDTFLLDISLHPEAAVCCHRFSLFGMLTFSRPNTHSCDCLRWLFKSPPTTCACFFAFHFFLTLGVQGTIRSVIPYFFLSMFRL